MFTLSTKNKWDLKLLPPSTPLQYISCQINSLSNICSIIFNSSSDSLWYETPHQIRASKRFFRHLGRVGRYEAVMQSRTSGGLKPAYWPSHNHVVTYCLPLFTPTLWIVYFPSGEILIFPFAIFDTLQLCILIIFYSNSVERLCFSCYNRNE